MLVWFQNRCDVLDIKNYFGGITVEGTVGRWGNGQRNFYLVRVHLNVHVKVSLKIGIWRPSSYNLKHFFNADHDIINLCLLRITPIWWQQNDLS